MLPPRATGAGIGASSGNKPFHAAQLPCAEVTAPFPAEASPPQAEATACSQQPLEATSPSSSLVAINRQSTGPSELAFSREQVPFQGGKMNMCFVVHAFGLNEPKPACQGTELFPKPDPLRHPDSQAGSEVRAAADDLSWQALALPRACRMLLQQPSKGQARWEQGLGSPPALGRVTGTCQQGLCCWLRPPTAPPEVISSESSSESAETSQDRRHLFTLPRIGAALEFGEGGRVETSAPTEHGWAWTSAHATALKKAVGWRNTARSAHK